MKNNPLRLLATFGQSVYLDFIGRGFIVGGELRRMIEEEDVRGVTTNPAIFEREIIEGHEYDEEIMRLAKRGLDAKAIYEALSQTDITMAADELRPLYERLEGRDGFVSLEINPHLAHDTKASIAEARRLWHTINRPNLLIKIPATDEGIPVITQLIGEGINVNATLLFGLDRYRQVLDAYLSGIEARLASGKPAERIASVASFFLSRIDTYVDPLIEASGGQDRKRAQLSKKLRGQIAVASAKMAYRTYREVTAGERFKTLAKKGARPQRLLWASTGTKNPDYGDVKYVEALIGPETVVTIPRETLAGFRDHGNPQARLEFRVEKALGLLDLLPELDIDVEAAARQLEEQGVGRFNETFNRLVASLGRHP